MLKFFKGNLFKYVLLITVSTSSCKKEVKEEKEVYNNGFETADLTNILGGTIEKFNNTNVLGRYNNGGFTLTVSGLPKHDLLEVSFDLYIHDSWDGNDIGGGINGPDIWEMLIDHGIYINTTFSNSYCNGTVECLPQSYPNNYPNNNQYPRTGAYQTNLPGACSQQNNADGTSLYKITKTINHSGSSVILQCLDQLIQTNAKDKKCDESWSVDNIKIKTIAL